jgi:hypothetical protein
VLVPRGDTEICDGDVLLIVVQESEHSAERVTAWARGEAAPGPDDIAPWPPDLGLAVLQEYPPLGGGDPEDDPGEAPAADRGGPTDASTGGATDAEDGADER